VKIAILGGGGAFALNFARLLEEKQIEHFGLGRSGPKASPFWLAPKNYKFWEIHLVDQMQAAIAVLDAMRPEIICNFAAQGEGAASFGVNAADFYRTNTWGFIRLVGELATRDYVKRFIQIGTSELYGSVDKPSKETDPVFPNSPYAISKWAFDRHLEVMFKIHEFPMNIIRPSNCYTPGQQLYRVIPKTIACALSGKRLQLHGGGKAMKSYLHATDLSKAILAVLDKGQIGNIYNCGPTGPITIKSLVSHVAEACGVMWEELVDEVPDRTGQDGKYWLDSTELSKDTFWTPTIGLANGLEGMVEWAKAYPEILTMPTEYQHRP
jgi:dTDP-glucose 4,6-dehydratase